MKIKITYTEGERHEADELAAYYVKRLKSRRRLTVSRSDRYKPYFHIYIADRLEKSHSKGSESTSKTKA